MTIVGMASGEEFLLGLAFIGVVAAIALISRELRGATGGVQYRNGKFYCPECGRQVSYRRIACRSCGYNFLSDEVPNRGGESQPFVDPYSRALGRGIWMLLEFIFSLPISGPVWIVRFIRDRLLPWMGEAFLPVARHVISFRWFSSVPEWSQPIILGLLLPVFPVVVYLVYRFLQSR